MHLKFVHGWVRGLTGGYWVICNIRVSGRGRCPRSSRKQIGSQPLAPETWSHSVSIEIHRHSLNLRVTKGGKKGGKMVIGTVLDP